MATEVVSTIKSSGGDYSTLSAWEAGEQRNLVAADEIEIAECYNFALTDDVAVSGWTTDATRYVKIRTPLAERHAGVAREVSGVGFSITPSGSVGAIRQGGGYLYLEGLDIKAQIAAVSSSSAVYLSLVDCIIHTTDSGTAYTLNVAPTALLRNCVVYGNSRSLDVRLKTSVTIQNCVFWRHAAQLGVLGDANVSIKNSFSGHAGAASDDWWTGGAPTGNNNASSDTTATSRFTSSVNSVSSASFVSVTSGAEDFHLVSGATALIGAGANLYSDFTTDIDGDTWPSSGAWDIGADYYVAAGGGLPTLSNARAGSITTTTAVPLVDYAY